MVGKSFYKSEDGDVWEYKLVLNPPEEIYWQPKSYRLKVTDIKVLTEAPADVKKSIRRDILEDIKLTDTRGNKNNANRM